jgi:hypothetical protein
MSKLLIIAFLIASTQVASSQGPLLSDRDVGLVNSPRQRYRFPSWDQLPNLPIKSAASSDCEDGHFLWENLADGKILKLEDGSVWKVSSYDAVTSMTWSTSDDIVICDGKLINVDDSEEVEATRIR